MDWQPIEDAIKAPGTEIIGTNWIVGRNGLVCVREPFVSFWSPTLNKFFGGPTHFVAMPGRPSK